PRWRPSQFLSSPGLGSIPIIAQITDYIYLGNLNAAYSGRALCTNGIDNIIDMSSLVDTQAFLHGNPLMEKGKRVLIHCRDGYSLGPTCVIQYLMVKHSMRLLAAYELVRARYPLKIQECHQDLLVGLEMSLQPGGVNTACLKHSLSRKMAWS
uniref:protein-tyrosine-phosphatase n=1 Tax=Coturnix japonica TaxID=93934 RepID=A0A8C2U6K5_COTJA